VCERENAYKIDREREKETDEKKEGRDGKGVSTVARNRHDFDKN